MATKATVGNVEILAFVDVTPPPFDPSRFFPGASETQWAPHKAEYLDKDGKFRTNFGFFALRSRDGIILVDTGLGAGPHQALGGVSGRLLDELGHQGIRPEDVTRVVITHFHGDHMGWNTTSEQGKYRPTFPKAKYLLPKGDWEYFTRPEILESPAGAPVKVRVLPLKDLGVVELVDGDYPVTREVSTLSTPGHTPGHISVVITSQGQKGIIIGDVMHSPVQILEPNWQMGADTDKELGVRSRNALLDRLEREGFVVGAGHFLINTNIGKVVRVGGRRYWQAL